MKILDGHSDKPKYFEALNIVRNKIVGSASEVLTNYNTVFNSDTIISRLNFTYADQRPVLLSIYILPLHYQVRPEIQKFYQNAPQCISLQSIFN